VITRPLAAVALGVLSTALGTQAAAAPAHLLARAPYLGVACPVPDSLACDRVGLAVWVTRPARAVNAAVGGRRFALDDPHWSGPARHGLRRMFAGFLQPAGLTRGALRVVPHGPYGRWAGGQRVSALVELAIRYGNGTQATVRLRIRLHAGWG